MLDLWQFNEKSLKKTMQELPDSILEEQAELLHDKTGGMIYGRIINMKFRPQNEHIKYNMAAVFEAVVPQLDNYNYTLLTVYSRAENDYPVAVTAGKNMIDDGENFVPEYECRNREEFIQALKAILSSDEVSRNISILYAKANI